MEKTNEILTIAGRRVEKRNCDDVIACCSLCCFGERETCLGTGEDNVWPCKKFDATTYFVPADEGIDKRSIKFAFMNCEYEWTIMKEMYGDKFNNTDNYRSFYGMKIHFLKQVEQDNRMGELADLLRKYGAIPAENSETDTTAQAQTVPSGCPTIKGWIARNKTPDELIFVPGNEAPTRMLNYWLAGFAWGYAVIPNVFPDLTWEDEPIEVELPIIVKKKK